MKKRILGVVAAALLLAGLAGADSNTYNYQGTGPYFNARNGARVNSTGSVLVDDVSRDRDASFTETNIIAAGALAGTSNLAAGAADSSAVLDTRHMRLGMLLIKAVPATRTGVDTSTTVRLIVQIRTHLNGGEDSTTTFAVYQYGVAPSLVATASAADTAQVGHLYKARPLTATFTTPSVIEPWSGEFVVVVSRSRTAIGSTVAVNGRTYYYPNGIAIPLSNLYGRDIFSPWTSVRVRNASPDACELYVSLVGTPL